MSNQLSFADKASATKCVFRHGTSVYDYTPFKIIYPNPTAPYFDGKRFPRSKDIQYWFEFGWCQHLNDISKQTYCREDFFAGRLDADPKPTTNSICTPYSGSSARKDIKTEAISGRPFTIKREEAHDFSKLNGIKLTYGNGPKCTETG